MRVVVIHNEPVLPPDHPEYASEAEAVETAEHITRTLRTSGLESECLGIGRDLRRFVHRLQEEPPDVVFNLFEGFAHQGESEAVVAGLLEWFAIPFTGSPSLTLSLCRDKPRAKAMMVGFGIPTPPFLTVEKLPCPGWTHGWPAIVKPGTQDASVGISHANVVSDDTALAARVAMLLDRYGPPVLVEQYIEGREFNVAVLADPVPRVLPVSEILFQPRNENFWQIVTYEAKWHAESADDLATRPQCPAEVDADLAARLESVALQAFERFGCRQYARCDFRVTRTGQPLLLEVNPNPDIHPLAGFANALRAARIPYERFVTQLVTSLRH